MESVLTVCGREYEIIHLLGHGKGGYSYLAQADGKQFVVKQIHHEPCNYSFVVSVPVPKPMSRTTALGFSMMVLKMVPNTSLYPAKG